MDKIGDLAGALSSKTFETINSLENLELSVSQLQIQDKEVFKRELAQSNPGLRINFINR